jgi:mannosyltransferase
MIATNRPDTQEAPAPKMPARTWRALVLAITALGGAVRLTGLGFQSLWLDEYLWTRTAALKSIQKIIDRHDGYPPTVALLFRVLDQAGLGSDAWLRLPAALLGTLAIPLAVVVARRLVGPRLALVAGALLAIHPLAVWYSQEAGAYAPAMLAALASTWCLLRLLDGAGIPAAIGYALSAGAGFGLHYYFAFVLMAQAPFGLVDLIRHPERRRAWIAAGLLGALAVGAWMPLFLDDVVGQTDEDRGRGGFSILAMPYTAQAFVGGFALGPSVRSLHPAVRSGETPRGVSPEAVVLPAAAILLATCLFLLALACPFAGRRGLLLAICIVPVLGPWFNSLLGVGYRPRYALVALPFAIILFVGGLATRRARLVAALLVAYVGLEVTGLVTSYTPDHRREDNRAAAAIVAAAGGGDVVLIGEGADPFQRYARDVDRLVMLEENDIANDAALAERMTPLLEGPKSLFLVSSRPWTEDPSGRVLAFFSERLALERVEEVAGVTVRQFGRERR